MSQRVAGYPVEVMGSHRFGRNASVMPKFEELSPKMVAGVRLQFGTTEGSMAFARKEQVDQIRMTQSILQLRR